MLENFHDIMITVLSNTQIGTDLFVLLKAKYIKYKII
jgi:hypothetical protein